MRVVIVGYKSTDQRIDGILAGLDYKEKIGIQSPAGKALRYLAKLNLEIQDKKISHYKRLYCLVGDDVAEQVLAADTRFVKKLAGKPVSDILLDLDVSALTTANEIFEGIQRKLESKDELTKIEDQIARITQSYLRGKKKYTHVGKDYWYSFDETHSAVIELKRLMANMSTKVLSYDPIEDLKRQLESVARRKKWL